MLCPSQVQSVLDVGCGFGSFGAHLVSLKLMVVCVAVYEATGSQVQLALERGLPAMIGNFISRQLPYPALSFDMVHCAQCGIIWDQKGTSGLIEHFSSSHWCAFFWLIQNIIWRKECECSWNPIFCFLLFA